jgi:hypothetical protein
MLSQSTTLRPSVQGNLNQHADALTITLCYHHYLPSFPPSRRISLPGPHFFATPIRNMHDQSGLESSNFSNLFESALQEYAKKTGKPLAGHPLAERLDYCDTLESVLDVLQDQASAFNESINSRITQSLNSIVPILHALSTNTAIRIAISVVRRKLGWLFYFSHTCSIAFPSCNTNICCPCNPPWRMCLSSLPTRISCDI